MHITKCPDCGLPLRRVRPALVIIRYQVVQLDDPSDPKVPECTNPSCPRSTFSGPEARQGQTKD